mgnify:CR=1 FL=1
MTTLTNSEGKALTYTNEFIETILLQLNSSNNYYTTGDDDVIFIKIGINKVLLLDYTYHINRNIFQNYSINENINNEYDLEFVLNGTSNEYTLQGVYTANSYIGTINTLQDVYLALYDTTTSPYSYSGSENIDITDNQISLTFPITVNGEEVFYDKTYIDNLDNELSTLILNTYTKQEVDTVVNTKQDTLIDKSLLFSLLYNGKYLQSIMPGDKITMEYVYSELDPNVRNIAISADLSDYYNKSHIDTNFYTSSYLESWINAETTVLENNFSNYYTTTYLDNFFTTLATLDYLHLKYTNSVVLAQNYYDKTETDNLFTNLNTISGDLNVGGTLNLVRTPSSAGAALTITNSSSSGATGASFQSTASGQGFLINYTTAQSATPWTTGVNWGGANDFIIRSNNLGLTLKSDGDALLTGDLTIGTVNDNSIKINTTGNATGYTEIRSINGINSRWDFQNGTHWQAWSSIKVKGSSFMDFSYHDNLIIHYKSLANWSDDRLKENEQLIENACETLSKLRPQIYDKKPDMENDDPTTWYKESGLIAQEVYYDCPELRHLVKRINNQTEPLPEIPTSLDPKLDPDYSSWGEEPAALNYIGLIAYLVKANNELHERVKALEG